MNSKMANSIKYIKKMILRLQFNCKNIPSLIQKQFKNDDLDQKRELLQKRIKSRKKRNENDH